MRVIFVLFLVLCSSCLSRQDGNIVSLKNIEDKIFKGMPKNDLIEKFGSPKDSVISEILEEGNYIYIYDTDDFSGYTLKIWFDNNNEVSHYRID